MVYWLPLNVSVYSYLKLKIADYVALPCICHMYATDVCHLSIMVLDICTQNE